MLKICLIFFVFGLAILATACASGQTKPPSEAELERDIQVLQVDLPDGTTIPCLFYARSGEDGIGDSTHSFSWIALECDWDRLQEGPRPVKD